MHAGSKSCVGWEAASPQVLYEQLITKDRVEITLEYFILLDVIINGIVFLISFSES